MLTCTMDSCQRSWNGMSSVYTILTSTTLESDMSAVGDHRPGDQAFDGSWRHANTGPYAWRYASMVILERTVIPTADDVGDHDSSSSNVCASSKSTVSNPSVNQA